MSEYPVGTVLEDCQGDYWRVQDDKSVRMNDWSLFDSVSDLEEEFGPLKVVEEPAGPSFTGLKPLVEGLAGRVFTTEDIPGLVRPQGFSSYVPRAVTEKAQASSGESFPQDAFSVYHESFNILLKKNADYGPSNIADSPGGPLNGILVRMWDKMSRLRHLVESGATPENESLRDTLMDMANYSLIAMIVLDGNWPGMEDK